MAAASSSGDIRPSSPGRWRLSSVKDRFGSAVRIPASSLFADNGGSRPIDGKPDCK